MTNGRERRWRAKAYTWLERDGRPDDGYVTVDPTENKVLTGGRDEEGRFVVMSERGEGENEPVRMVGDRRHWTEVPPKME
jgi:hypothetical protein